MKHLVVCAVAAASCLGVAHAQENQAYECRHRDDVRSVAVEYSATGGAASCRVLYKKVAASSGPATQLWHYQGRSDMCAVQAQQFLKRLESFGLACSPPAAATRQ